MKTSLLKSSRQQKLIVDGYRSLASGGDLRKRRRGRTARPLSSKDSHHIVFKINPSGLKNRSFRHPRNFKWVQWLLKRYSEKFFIKIEQISYQHDHIHIMARSSRRSNFHSFFRVFAGQVAQTMKVAEALPSQTGIEAVTDTQKNQRNRNPVAVDELTDSPRNQLWKHRPFTRVIKGWSNYKRLTAYIILNEKEVTGEIPYRKNRTRGLSSAEWILLARALGTARARKVTEPK